MLPPRRVRRFTGPLLIAVLVAAVLSLPLLVVVAAIVSVWFPGRWYVLRLLCFALIYLALEVAGLAAAAVIWALSGFGRRADRPEFLAVHYSMLRLLLDVVMRSAQRLFNLRLVTDGESWSPLDDGVPGSTNAMVVLSRHAGPGDSFLLVHTLMNRDHLRQPRIVLKDVLQLDPLIDVYLNRLPNHFVTVDPAAGVNQAEAVGEPRPRHGRPGRAADLPGGRELHPEAAVPGDRTTPEPGLVAATRRAEAMQNVLPPRPAGVTAALRAAPHADVVFVAHTGLEHLSTVRDVWRGLPTDKTLHLRWWFVPAADVPRDENERTDWLYGWWEAIDDWIATTQRQEATNTKPRTRTGRRRRQ